MFHCMTRSVVPVGLVDVDGGGVVVDVDVL
jgi:hypothetical protein